MISAITSAFRKTDPQTSRLAYERLVESGEKEKHVETILSILKICSGVTAHEIAWAATNMLEKPMTNVQVTRRTNEMERKGLITRGLDPGKCSVSGRMMTTYFISKTEKESV